LLDLTNIKNIEKSIERMKKKNCFGRIPKNLDELGITLKNEKWKRLMDINETHSFIMECVYKNNSIKAVVFIDKYTTEVVQASNEDQLTLFVDGTFATVPQLNNNNCQLWTIVIRHNDRVSKTI
jgi:hypothetical protein